MVISFNIPLEYECSHNAYTPPKPLWHMASDDNKIGYKISLDDKLRLIKVPWHAIQCNDVFFKDHFHQIQQFHDNIIQACLDAGYEHIPYSSDSHTKVIPGWNDYVEPLRKQAFFGHNIWQDNNSPRHGIIADIRRKTRCKYHYALRYVKHNNYVLKANKLAEAMTEGYKSDFWNVVRKIKCKRNSRPKVMDNGVSKPGDIANVFANKYESLYTSVPYDQNEMIMLRQRIDYLIRFQYGNY